jgi:hypothetical protein
LFGFGIGNATSLPPLIAQVEFLKDDVARVVPLIVAISQGTYAFAPATFGLIRQFGTHATSIESGTAPHLFIAAAVIQGAAIIALMLGRLHTSEREESATGCDAPGAPRRFKDRNLVRLSADSGGFADDQAARIHCRRGPCACQ